MRHDDEEQAEDAEFALIPSQGAGAQMAVRASYATAMSVQKPRTLPSVEKALLAESQMAGELFYYGFPAGDKGRIEGGSIGLAMAAARCWGNCAIETLPVQDAGDAWIFTSAFVDLETGFTVSRQFRQSKKAAVGMKKADAERKDDIRFQVGQSKAARNVIFNAIPRWLTDKAIEEAKKGVRNKLEAYINKNGIAAAQDYAVKALANFGVKPEDICDKFEIAAVAALSVENLVVLKGDLSALQQGQERAATLYPSMGEPAPAAAKVKKSDLNERVEKSSTPETAETAEKQPERTKTEAEPEKSSTKEPETEAQAFLRKMRQVFGIRTFAQARKIYDGYLGPEGTLEEEWQIEAVKTAFGEREEKELAKKAAKGET